MLGNWVYDGERTQFPMQVVGIGKDYVYLDFEGNEGDLWESTPSELQGIPLTDDLLERLGFHHNGHGLWSRGMQGRTIRINMGSEFVAIEAFEDRLLDSRCTCHGIKYLHQLQNLFKTVSKEELKIQIWK